MTGRWPANVILAPAMAEALDEQSGVLKSGPRNGATNGNVNRSVYGKYNGGDNGATFQADSGGASRFFLTAGYEPWELEWILANGLTPCGLGEVEG